MGGVSCPKWGESKGSPLIIKYFVMGNLNTFFGNIDPNVMKNLSQGNGNTVVGSTDNNGNTVLNQSSSIAVGIGASAGKDSIAIGAYAGAGIDIFESLFLLKSKVLEEKDDVTATKIDELIQELKKTEKDSSKISTLWGVIFENASKIKDVLELVKIITPLIISSCS